MNTHPLTASFRSGTQMLSSPQSNRIWAWKTHSEGGEVLTQAADHHGSDYKHASFYM